MFFICGYDFCKDENALNPSPLNVAPYSSTKLENGIFSHWYITKNGEEIYTSIPPTDWDFLTIMNANFDGTIQAGNINFLEEGIDGIKIKRRNVNDFNWITLRSEEHTSELQSRI